MGGSLTHRLEAWGMTCGLEMHAKNCGSELARESGITFNINVD
jgi:hypothetical protein